jgi:flavin-dependent dehydrogenase
MGDHSGSDTMSMMETDLLIVGTGPAGGSLACFLASYGKKELLSSHRKETELVQV